MTIITTGLRVHFSKRISKQSNRQAKEASTTENISKKASLKKVPWGTWKLTLDFKILLQKSNIVYLEEKKMKDKNKRLGVEQNNLL